MKVRIDQDEFWPWHTFPALDDKFGEVFEVEEATYERWRKALNEAAKVQAEISKFIGWDK